ncbi:MAG TPA: LysM domain-containing protein [Gaiellaceae bacterium]|nr:LysM domain-containing protein [Gaiellaceae bacterium]
MLPEAWRRYVAPAAFLLAATIAIVLIRSGIEAGHAPSSSTTGVLTLRTTPKRVATTPTTTGAAATPAAPRFWTVRAGDTFGVISTKSGVPVVTIEQLNPTVHSTSLYIGQKIRLR